MLRLGAVGARRTREIRLSPETTAQNTTDMPTTNTTFWIVWNAPCMSSRMSFISLCMISISTNASSNSDVSTFESAGVTCMMVWMMAVRSFANMST